MSGLLPDDVRASLLGESTIDPLVSHEDPHEGAHEREPEARPRRGRPASIWGDARRRLLRRPEAVAALAVLALVVLFSFAGPLLSPYSGLEIDLGIREQAPNAWHWLGTDSYGRDVMTRLMEAGRISMTIAIASVVLSLLLGAVLGMTAGYFGGLVDGLIMRVADVLLSIPGLPLLIVIAAILSEWRVPPESRVFVVMLMLSVIGWPGLARLIRGQVLALREELYMRATEVLGLSTRSRLFHHLLPNVLPLLIVVATLSTASGILSESALSFLGLGVMAPTASWGNMIDAANSIIDFQQRWWLWVPPGTAILVTVVAINVLGDALRDVLDPKLRKG